MAADDAGTFAQLKTLRKELIEPKTAEYNGRVIKLMGDGTLMEFASVVDTVNFAVDVQRAMMERNVSVPEDLQIRYRVTYRRTYAGARPTEASYVAARDPLARMDS